MTVENAKATSRVEAIRPGTGEVTPLGQGVSFRELVSGACTAIGFSTGIVTIEGGAVVLRDSEGKVLKFVGTTTDIDDQKRTEEALRQAQGDLRVSTG
jgi:PAS domain-containing protein